MWQITTPGFMLQDVLILVALNLEPTLTVVNPSKGRCAIKRGGYA